MEGTKVALSRMPGWLFTSLTMAAILWLTLSPKPLGEKPPPLFPGADKIAHAIMFGGLVAMMQLDWQRKHGWIRINMPRSFIYALAGSLFGVAIEIAQGALGWGRSFEYNDIAADTVGAFFFAFCYLFIQNFWTPTHNK